jgi:two-component system response regulator GlrR
MGTTSTAKADIAPLPLVLHCFTDDKAVADRLLALLSALQPSAVLRISGSAAHEPASPELPSAATILLVAPPHLDTACALVQRLRRDRPAALLVVCTLGVDPSGVARLLAVGAADFARLEAADAEIVLRLRHAFGLLPRLCMAQAHEPPLPASLCAQLIGRAPGFMRVVRRVPAMAASGANVLLLGETGTGKEVFAQAIHYHSPRAAGPWVAANCAAVPAELLEDELFGHVRGAYTHAMGARDGLAQEADGGTLFLDEIDSLPLPAQAKLLRFLQDKQYRRIGSNQLIKADVRVVAASNRDLCQAAAAGRFREDLFFRLNVLRLTLPPLRERQDDIALLAAHFLEQTNREAGRCLSGLSPSALNRLQAHAWPGNVRELKHVIQRAVVLAQGPTLRAADIELDGQPDAADDAGADSFREAKARAVEAFERQYLQQLLAQSDGNISRAARAARKNRRALFELLRRHGIDAARYRAHAG